MSEEQKGWIREQVEKAEWAEVKRPHELEADRYGAYLALSAGADPKGVSEAFGWMEEQQSRLSELTGPKLQLAIQTDDHPLPEQRFAVLSAIWGDAPSRQRIAGSGSPP